MTATRGHPGCKRTPDRQELCGILFVLHTSIQWEFQPQQLGFGSGMTCWRRLEQWNRARGVAAAVRTASGRAAVCGQAGLVPGSNRLLTRAGRPAWPKKRPEPELTAPARARSITC